MKFIAESLRLISIFLKKRADLIFSVLLVDYAILIFWEYFAHGMVNEVFSPEWLLLGMFIFLFWGKTAQDKLPVEEDLFSREIKFALPFLIFLFSLVVFFDWWAINWLIGVIFTLFSTLILFFLSRYLANQEKP